MHALQVSGLIAVCRMDSVVEHATEQIKDVLTGYCGSCTSHACLACVSVQDREGSGRCRSVDCTAASSKLRSGRTRGGQTEIGGGGW